MCATPISIGTVGAPITGGSSGPGLTLASATSQVSRRSRQASRPSCASSLSRRASKRGEGFDGGFAASASSSAVSSSSGARTRRHASGPWIDATPSSSSIRSTSARWPAWMSRSWALRCSARASSVRAVRNEGSRMSVWAATSTRCGAAYERASIRASSSACATSPMTPPISTADHRAGAARGPHDRLHGSNARNRSCQTYAASTSAASRVPRTRSRMRATISLTAALRTASGASNNDRHASGMSCVLNARPRPHADRRARAVCSAASSAGRTHGPLHGLTTVTCPSHRRHAAQPRSNMRRARSILPWSRARGCGERGALGDGDSSPPSRDAARPLAWGVW